jgi:hypothetical protein
MVKALILGAILIALVGCSSSAPQSQITQTPLPTSNFQPTVQHYSANGCRGEHDTLYLAGGHINAYPAFPPNAQPEHIVLHFDNGTVIWGKPSYGSPDCGSYASCQRATFILNSAFNQCSPRGNQYEVLSLDGKPVLDSSLLQIVDPKSKGTVYIAFTANRAFAAPNLTSLAAQVDQNSALSKGGQIQGAVASASGNGQPQEHPYLEAGVAIAGMTLAAAAILGVAYFAFRASQAQAEPTYCTTTQTGTLIPTWQTTCY